jgi:hypothetical protein
MFVKLVDIFNNEIFLNVNYIIGFKKNGLVNDNFVVRFADLKSSSNSDHQLGEVEYDYIVINKSELDKLKRLLTAKGLL